MKVNIPRKNKKHLSRKTSYFSNLLIVQPVSKPIVQILIKAWNFILCILKFIFRDGAILDLTCDDLEGSTTLDDENITFSANCNNTIFNSLS